jgi:3-hydroxyisobutyrate dehydrogenase-like beta-hydroxyacid dehydrogenase
MSHHTTPTTVLGLGAMGSALARRPIAAGHGKEGFARIFEELRSTR